MTVLLTVAVLTVLLLFSYTKTELFLLALKRNCMDSDGKFPEIFPAGNWGFPERVVMENFRKFSGKFPESFPSGNFQSTKFSYTGSALRR
jgi:hypothetical protein